MKWRGRGEGEARGKGKCEKNCQIATPEGINIVI